MCNEPEGSVPGLDDDSESTPIPSADHTLFQSARHPGRCTHMSQMVYRRPNLETIRPVISAGNQSPVAPVLSAPFFASTIFMPVFQVFFVPHASSSRPPPRLRNPRFRSFAPPPPRELAIDTCALQNNSTLAMSND